VESRDGSRRDRAAQSDVQQGVDVCPRQVGEVYAQRLVSAGKRRERIR
jgi:hypothetical protein